MSGQKGRVPQTLRGGGYPLDKRKAELQSEEHYPVDSRWTDEGMRTPTAELVDENSDQGRKVGSGLKMSSSPQSETWDEVNDLEKNLRLKFIQKSE